MSYEALLKTKLILVIANGVKRSEAKQSLSIFDEYVGMNFSFYKISLDNVSFFLHFNANQNKINSRNTKMTIKKLLQIARLATLLFMTAINAIFSQSRMEAANPGIKNPGEVISNFQKSFSTAPPFNALVKLKAGNTTMKVDTYTSVPCAVDWNGDGKKDLLVGCFYFGNVFLYLNSGTNSAPVFTSASKLKAGGQDIAVAYG